MLSLALASKPPTGFLRDIVVEAGSGEHRGTFDIKQGVCCRSSTWPATAGAPRRHQDHADRRAPACRRRTRGCSTRAGRGSSRRPMSSSRHAARAPGEPARGGAEPDNHIDPKQLNPLTRRYLRDAFREVAAVQRSLVSRARPGWYGERDSPASAVRLPAGSLPAAATPWRDAVFSVVDLELTGLDPAVDEIISFATVTVAGGGSALMTLGTRGSPDAGCPTATRSASTGSAGAISPRHPAIRGARRSARGVHRKGARSPTWPRSRRIPRRGARQAHGLDLRNPVIDTAALAKELRRRAAASPAETGAPPVSRLLARTPRLARSRPTGPPSPSRRRGRPDRGAGLPGPGHPSGSAPAADRRLAGAMSRLRRDRALPSLQKLAASAGRDRLLTS